MAQPLWDRMSVVQAVKPQGFTSMDALYASKTKPLFFPPDSCSQFTPEGNEPRCICHKCKRVVRLEDAVYGYPEFHGFGTGPEYYGPPCARKLKVVRAE